MNLTASARLLTLTAGLLFCLSLSCKARSVQINLGNEAGGNGDEPLKALAAALTQVNSRYIRITWDCDALSLSSTITALYDRHRKTIRYCCSGGHSMGGHPAQTVYAHYLYTRVTDQIIRKASVFLRTAAPYPNAVQAAPTYAEAGTPGSYYDALLTFGGHRKKLP